MRCACKRRHRGRIQKKGQATTDHRITKEALVCLGSSAVRLPPGIHSESAGAPQALEATQAGFPRRPSSDSLKGVARHYRPRGTGFVGWGQRAPPCEPPFFPWAYHRRGVNLLILRRSIFVWGLFSMRSVGTD
jgi:hypothetical protein